MRPGASQGQGDPLPACLGQCVAVVGRDAHAVLDPGVAERLVHIGQAPAGDMHHHMMLKVVVDPIGRDQCAGDGACVGGAHVLQRVL